VRVDGAPHDPERTCPALDPEDDLLLSADVVDPREHPLRIPTVA
jgi:hypothetical protein